MRLFQSCIIVHTKFDPNEFNMSELKKMFFLENFEIMKLSHKTFCVFVYFFLTYPVKLFAV